MATEAVPTRDAAHYERHVSEVAAAERAPVAVPPCPVCEAQKASPRFTVEGTSSRVVVCVDCGLGRLHPLPTLEEVRALYPDEYYGEPGAGRKFQPLIERLVRYAGDRHIAFLSRELPRDASVLDLGCGRGVILGALAERGFEAHGVELSAEAARGADPRAEIRIAPTLAEAGYEAERFDEAIIWHVLEHLHDPRATIAEAHRVLKRAGRLVVAVPNFESVQARWTGPAWFHLDLPRHLHQFPLSALRLLLESTGFEVVSEHHFSLRQNPFGWVQSWLNRIPRLPRNGLYTLLHQRAAGEGAPSLAP